MNPPITSNIRRVKRIAPLQAGKILGILYGLLGLIIVPFMLLFGFVGAMAGAGAGANASAGGVFAAMGIGMMIGFPILYAFFGFVGGIIVAAIYNLIAGWVGGFEVEVE